MSIETPSQSNRAADRLKQFDTKPEEITLDEYWDELIGDAGETDFSDNARRRLEEAAAYDAHLEKISKDSNYGTLNGLLNRAESGDYKDAEERHIDGIIAADPKLRRLVLMADIYNNLRNQPNKSNLDKAEERVDQKEQDLLEAMIAYEESSTLSENDLTEVINRISDRMYQTATPTERTSTTPTVEAAPSVDTDRDALAKLEAADVSLDTTTETVTTTKDVKSTPEADAEELKQLAEMDAADVSLTEVKTIDATTGTTPEDISVLESMEPADVSLADINRADNDDEPFLNVEELKQLAEMEPADVSLETNDDDDHPLGQFLNVEEIQEEAAHEQEVAENHRRNRFNPLYRARLALNNLGRSRREHNTDNERRSRASKLALGAAAVGALALGSLVALKNNPDWAQDLNTWAGDVWNNLGLDGNNPSAEQAPDTGNTGDALDPRDGASGSGSNTPGEQAPVAPSVPELLNSAAFNTPNGGGGEALMNSLNVDPRTWYSISGDLPDLFPTEFYREQLPSGLVDIRFSHPGMLSEEAQKVVLNRLGK